jgi:hypothetical protein
MKRLIFIFLLCPFAFISAQQSSNCFDIRIGAGGSFLGTGDMFALTVENELNYKINHFIATSTSLNFGKSDYGVFKSASFYQGNINIFLSPFKNTKQNDFRIGAGVSYWDVSDAWEESSIYVDNRFYYTYIFERNQSYGLNLIIENTYKINNHYIVGIKAFTQNYTNSSMNSGILIKIGYVF